MSQQILLETADFGAGPASIGEVEQWCVGRGYRYIIGVDEAGRGPLAGPVFAAAVVLDLERLEEGWLGQLDDSKKLDEPARDAAFEAIRESAIAFGIAQCDRARIDEINILQATFRAMEEAARSANAGFDGRADCVFIDGNKTVELALPQRAVVKGDARSRAIAAASILAKVSRDALMREYHEKWPVYNFASNKGYPTREHRDAIAKFGPCPIHRRTFRGVKEHI
jgi:ribonuclease HII